VTRYFVCGGLGFIGHHVVKRLLKEQPDCEIVIYDNLSSGKLEFLEDVKDDSRLKIIIGDIKDLPKLIDSMKNIDTVWHFASNPNISAAITDPTIDFYEGTLLTQNILESMRINGVKKIIYASGSGVYGDAGETEMDENYSPMIPISTYGASKIAGESLISSYCHMFDIVGRVYRFANVIGSNPTHGVILAFIEKLKNNPKQLEILGNSKQSKSYIYVEDIIDGILATESASKKQYDYFNIATQDYIEVNEIADIICEEMKLDNVEYHMTSNETRGWKGDIGVCRFDTNKIRSYGWGNKFTTREAVRKVTREILYNEKFFDNHTI